MKNIFLYYRINIFIELYWFRTKLIDAGYLLGDSTMVRFLQNEDYTYTPIEFYVELNDKLVWIAWLKIIGINADTIEGHDEWWNYNPGEFIRKSGSIEIPDDMQKEYLLSFTKYIETEFDLNLDVFYQDLEKDPQTQKEWQLSWELLMKHYKN